MLQCVPDAGVVKLVDTLALGASAARHGGSSPLSGTNEQSEEGDGETATVFCSD